MEICQERAQKWPFAKVRPLRERERREMGRELAYLVDGEREERERTVRTTHIPIKFL